MLIVHGGAAKDTDRTVSNTTTDNSALISSNEDEYKIIRDRAVSLSHQVTSHGDLAAELQLISQLIWELNR